MKTLAFAAAALALSTSLVFAENPNFGIPKDLQPARAAATATYGAPAVRLKLLSGSRDHANPAANRYGDAGAR